MEMCTVSYIPMTTDGIITFPACSWDPTPHLHGKCRNENRKIPPYEHAPRSNVTVNPAWIATKSAAAEPSTEVAPLIAHTQDIDPCVLLLIDIIPRGKGIPMAIPRAQVLKIAIMSRVTHE